MVRISSIFSDNINTVSAWDKFVGHIKAETLTGFSIYQPGSAVDFKALGGIQIYGKARNR